MNKVPHKNILFYSVFYHADFTEVWGKQQTLWYHKRSKTATKQTGSWDYFVDFVFQGHDSTSTKKCKFQQLHLNNNLHIPSANEGHVIWLKSPEQLLNRAWGENVLAAIKHQSVGFASPVPHLPSLQKLWSEWGRMILTHWVLWEKS